MMKVLLFMGVIMTSIVSLQVKIQDLIPVLEPAGKNELLSLLPALQENQENELAKYANSTTQQEIFLQQQQQAGAGRARDMTYVLDERDDGAVAAGWSNKEITKAGDAGNVHGPWGNNVKSVTKTIDLKDVGSGGQCTVTWRSWAVATRDGESDVLDINGKTVWHAAGHADCRGPWTKGAKNFPNNRGIPACYYDGSWTGACSDSLTLTFKSNIDQDETDESWAFSDVTVSVPTYVTYALDERDDGAVAAGWSNKEITKAGDAGNVHGPWGNNVKSVTKTIDLKTIDVGSGGQCTVTWRSWAVATRDGETDVLDINGKTVWAAAGHADCRGPWTKGPTNFPNKRSQPAACYYDGSWTGACSDSLTLTFKSNIDQDETDESWAFSDVTVSVPAAGHDSIFNILTDIKKSIKNELKSDTNKAAKECTSDTKATVAVVWRDTNKDYKYQDLTGCAAGSECEKSTLAQQKLAAAAYKELVIRRAEGETLAAELKSLETQEAAKKKEKVGLEKDIVDNGKLHKKRMAKLSSAIKSLTKINDHLMNTGEIKMPTLLEEEKNVIGNFKVGKVMLLMLNQAATGVKEKELIATLKKLLASCISSLESSTKVEKDTHDNWVKLKQAKIKGCTDAIKVLVDKKAKTAAKITANDIIIVNEDKKYKNALATHKTERESCVAFHNNFVAAVKDYNSEIVAIDKMFTILNDAKLNEDTQTIRDETEKTKHGVKESVDQE